MRQIKLLIMFAFLFGSCKKSVEERHSKEVLITVLNTCICTIVFSDTTTGRTQKEIWDCSEIKTLPVYLNEGIYKVVAEGEGKKAELFYLKKKVAQTLLIEL